jgi:general secretion pathway protein B
MSFILDALRKSENERARQNGPALLEARVLPPRRGVPVWAIVVGVVLAANLAVLTWVVLRTSSTPAPVAAPPQTASVPAPAPAPAPAQAPAATPVQPANPPPAAAPPSLSQPTVAAPPPSFAPASPPPGAAVVNPADYAPARPAGSTPPRPAAPPARASTNGYGLDPTLPSASDLTASGSGLPAMRLSLHAYADDPADRYVLINSQRLREGETTSEGARVEAIAPEGALMSWRGQRFRLLPGE